MMRKQIAALVLALLGVVSVLASGAAGHGHTGGDANGPACAEIVGGAASYTWNYEDKDLDEAGRALDSLDDDSDDWARGSFVTRIETEGTSGCHNVQFNVYLSNPTAAGGNAATDHADLDGHATGGGCADYVATSCLWQKTGSDVAVLDPATGRGYVDFGQLFVSNATGAYQAQPGTSRNMVGEDPDAKLCVLVEAVLNSKVVDSYPDDPTLEPCAVVAGGGATSYR